MDKKFSKKKKIKNRILILFLLFVILIFASGLSIYLGIFSAPNSSPSIDNSKSIDSTIKATRSKDTNFIKAVLPDSTDESITFSNYKDYLAYDEQAGNFSYARFTGRRINIAITGLDSRIGTTSNHADANHIISILIDSGKIEIISVPRDTPADAGLDDSTGLNKLTVVRAVRGREAYLNELARIAMIDKIHYYIEVTFSQVIGILDFLGYKNAKSVLQVLRSRKGLGGDDYQRCYNQAQFIRQTILNNYSKINNGILGNLMLRAGLALINTNLTYNDAQSIISKLNLSGFTNSPNEITIKIRPPIPIKFKVYDFTNQELIEKLIKKIENFNIIHNEKDSIKIDVFSLLNNVLSVAERDTMTKPKSVISKLKTYYEQKAWLQIENEDQREQIRSRFESCLVSAYRKLNQPLKAKEVKEQINFERELFKLKNKQ